MHTPLQCSPPAGAPRRSEYQCSIDGAYSGTTFPHLLLMTYPMYRPPKAADTYVPRVFGFKLHPSAYGNRWATHPV